MINVIETLFGVAIAAALGALFLRWRGRPGAARRLAVLAGISFVVAAALEVYVRYFA
jgi:high-affinity Fe2+/Pb2+ permease